MALPHPRVGAGRSLVRKQYLHIHKVNQILLENTSSKIKL